MQKHGMTSTEGHESKVMENTLPYLPIQTPSSEVYKQWPGRLTSCINSLFLPSAYPGLQGAQSEVPSATTAAVNTVAAKGSVYH